MRADLLSVLKEVDIKNWKKVKVEFTGGPLVVLVPSNCVELTMKKADILKNPRKEIEKALNEPLGGLSLERIIQAKGIPAGELKVAITVSDITRPVPYKGKNGILLPLLKKLHSLGVERQNIRIIVGTGTHRASTPEEKIEMFGKEIVSAYEIQDHDCEDKACLVYVGKTPSGTEVFLNKNFY